MRNIMTISIPNKLKNELDSIVKEEGMTKSEFIRESIKEYIHFKKLNKLRDKMIIKAQKQGIFTDQDIFNRIS